MSNLELAQEAVRYVRAHVKYSSNKIGDRLAFAGGVEQVIRGRQGCDTQLWNTHQVIRRGMAFSEEYANRVILNGIGNCGEMALIAYIWLRNHGARPVDYMQFGNRPPATNHAWVTVGRLTDSDLTNLRSWGPDAVWCDPWQGDGMAFSVLDLVQGKVRNLNWQFNLNRVDLIEQGWPTAIMRFE